MKTIKYKKIKYKDRIFYNIDQNLQLMFDFKTYLNDMGYIAFIVNNLLFFEEQGLNALSFQYADDYWFNEQFY